jgi:hypothetical protein
MHFSKYRGALLSACLPIAFAISSCTQPAPAPPATVTPVPPAQTPAERGKVLVQVGGCHDCHTTKKAGAPDMSVMLSGAPASIKLPPASKVPAGSPWIIQTTDTLTAWSGPWGTSFAANLTPDPDTGLKSSAWSEDAFLKAMKTGKHIGTGRDILPPMPWQMYSQLGDDDLKAIWAYLQTIPPVKNEVPDPIPPAK